MAYDKELRALATEHASSWLAYLAVDTLDNHEKNKGVDPEYRPRGYNQGPKEEEEEESAEAETETDEPALEVSESVEPEVDPSASAQQQTSKPSSTASTFP
jgi:hypothetical protein